MHTHRSWNYGQITRLQAIVALFERLLRVFVRSNRTQIAVKTTPGGHFQTVSPWREAPGLFLFNARTRRRGRLVRYVIFDGLHGLMGVERCSGPFFIRRMGYVKKTTLFLHVSYQGLFDN